MFFFPFLTQNGQGIRVPSEWNGEEDYSYGYEAKASHSIERTDGMRSLSGPFCMNIMAKGFRQSEKFITFTSLSEQENFRLERNGVQQVENNVREDVLHEDNWGIKMHQHDYFELMYVLEGEIEQRIEEGSYLYEKGRTCILNRNTRHYEAGGVRYVAVYLCLSKEYVKELVENDLLNGIGQGMLCDFFCENLEEETSYRKDYLDFDFRKNLKNKEQVQGRIEELLEHMVRELQEKKPGYMQIFRGLLERFLGLLQDEELFESSHIILNSNSEAILFSRVSKMMEQNKGELTRADLAKELHYSGDYINRIVKKHSGMNISQYNQMIRLKKARELLETSSENVSEILSELGFENRAHFYKMFQERYGMTPLQYRKEHKK